MAFDPNCSYCAEGKLLEAFGIKIGELPMSKVILFKEQSHRGRCIVACKRHVDDITNLNKEERAQFTTLLNSGFTDTFRYLYPEEVKYSWWSYRFQARQKNAGWRIDYFVISDRLRERLADAKIHTDIFGSDHCPVELDLL